MSDINPRDMKAPTNNTIQAFWVSLGSLFSFSFTIVSSIILSRYLSKADYGTYRQVLYVYSTLLVVFTLGLPKAFSYFLPQVAMDQAKCLIKRITNLFFLLGALFSLLLFIFAPQIAHMLKNEDLALALRIFSPVPFFMLPTMGLEGILATYRKTKFIAVYSGLTRILMLIAVTVPVVFFGKGYMAAIAGFVGATFITFLLALYFKYMPLKGYSTEDCPVSYSHIFRFSMPLLYASIWGMLIKSADQFFISRYFGPEVFADFSNGFMEIPFVAMIIGACSTVLAPLFSKHVHGAIDPKSEIFPLWRSVFEKTAKIVYPLVIFSWFYAYEIMALLFGAQYEPSGSFFRIKLVVNFFTLIAYAPLILAIGATRFYANVHLIHALVLILLELACVYFFPTPHLLATISVLCRVGTVAAMLIFLSKHFSVSLLNLIPLKTISKVSGSAILAVWITHYTLSSLQTNAIVSIILSFTVFFCVFWILSLFCGLRYLSILRPLTNNRTSGPQA